MIEIQAFYIPLILLIVSWLLQIMANGSFSQTPQTQGGFFMIFITAILSVINILFYGAWGVYWLFTHIRIT